MLHLKILAALADFRTLFVKEPCRKKKPQSIVLVDYATIIVSLQAHLDEIFSS
ncbi:MAG TPA: hypothetical protein PLO59_08545 [Bacteroidia bacterium]|nr:hypothetical protein [Bacteroidia bacterium]